MSVHLLWEQRRSRGAMTHGAVPAAAVQMAVTILGPPLLTKDGTWATIPHPTLPPVMLLYGDSKTQSKKS